MGAVDSEAAKKMYGSYVKLHNDFREEIRDFRRKERREHTPEGPLLQ